MKLLVIITAFVAVYSCNEIPTNPGDNSHYVEGVSRYIWMPDSEGIPHLVDLQEPVQEDITTFRNGANNQYWIFTRQNPNNRQVIVHGNENSIWVSNYRGDRPIKVIAHGWNGSGNNNMNTLITSAFLADQDANVIVLDWSSVANSLYLTASRGVPSVGEHLASFLTWLINTAGGDWNRVHLVGFSLGAHVVGNAGRAANGRPARVTGLDPAGPGWTISNNALSTAAAQYVEAIHTDGGILGIFNAIAHGDFYPNGGRHPQPGCFNNNCSHGRAVELFAATVRFNNMVGQLCGNRETGFSSTYSGPSSLHMGNAVIPKFGDGMYCLTTRNAWPF